jgi:hypothetical protein
MIHNLKQPYRSFCGQTSEQPPRLSQDRWSTFATRAFSSAYFHRVRGRAR